MTTNTASDSILVTNSRILMTKLCHLLCSPIYEGFRHLWSAARRKRESGETASAYCAFQESLTLVKDWNLSTIEGESRRIVQKVSEFRSIDSLIRTVFILYARVLSSVRVKKELDITVPRTADFIHRVYLIVGREFYNQPKLMEDRREKISGSDLQKNTSKCIKIIENGIESAVRDMLPLDVIVADEDEDPFGTDRSERKFREEGGDSERSRRSERRFGDSERSRWSERKFREEEGGNSERSRRSRRRTDSYTSEERPTRPPSPPSPQVEPPIVANTSVQAPSEQTSPPPPPPLDPEEYKIVMLKRRKGRRPDSSVGLLIEGTETTSNGRARQGPPPIAAPPLFSESENVAKPNFDFFSDADFP